ncbi:hypothetical protein G3I76_29410 [Streptomyces sp. SID11233]|nr:hypothetical protein [Streptomyces sp. SID11233]
MLLARRFQAARPGHQRGLTDPDAGLHRRRPAGDLSVLTDPDRNLAVIVKDGQVFKNLLDDDK